jgi:hypothetical protein
MEFGISGLHDWYPLHDHHDIVPVFSGVSPVSPRQPLSLLTHYYGPRSSPSPQGPPQSPRLSRQLSRDAVQMANCFALCSYCCYYCIDTGK